MPIRCRLAASAMLPFVSSAECQPSQRFPSLSLLSSEPLNRVAIPRVERSCRLHAFLASGPVVRLDVSQIFMRRYIGFPLRGDPFVQRGFSNAETISNLPARLRAGQRDRHRIFAQFFRSSMSRIHLVCRRICYQWSGAKRDRSRLARSDKRTEDE